MTATPEILAQLHDLARRFPVGSTVRTRRGDELLLRSAALHVESRDHLRGDATSVGAFFHWHRYEAGTYLSYWRAGFELDTSDRSTTDIELVDCGSDCDRSEPAALAERFPVGARVRSLSIPGYTGVVAAGEWGIGRAVSTAHRQVGMISERDSERGGVDRGRHLVSVLVDPGHYLGSRFASDLEVVEWPTS